MKKINSSAACDRNSLFPAPTQISSDHGWHLSRLPLPDNAYVHAHTTTENHSCHVSNVVSRTDRRAAGLRWPLFPAPHHETVPQTTARHTHRKRSPRGIALAWFEPHGPKLSSTKICTHYFASLIILFQLDIPHNNTQFNTSKKVIIITNFKETHLFCKNKIS